MKLTANLIENILAVIWSVMTLIICLIWSQGYASRHEDIILYQGVAIGIISILGFMTVLRLIIGLLSHSSKFSNINDQTKMTNDIQCSSVVEDVELMLSPILPGQFPAELSEREYGSHHVGLPHSAFHETEDERKNRLSPQRIEETRCRLLSDKKKCTDQQLCSSSDLNHRL